MQLKKDYKTISTEELLQWYANADSTCSCGGHWKGEQNELRRLNYALELRNRGFIVPKDLTEILDKEFISNVDIPKGIFNGEGSY